MVEGRKALNFFFQILQRRSWLWRDIVYAYCIIIIGTKCWLESFYHSNDMETNEQQILWK